ncbi:MAG: hypothetical protein Q9188_006099 [Gyalolechia gomerana]
MSAMKDRINIRGNIAKPESTQINNVNLTTTYTVEDINRDCLHTLRCPDTLVIKNRLKENKDKLLYGSIKWIFQDPQYLSWQDRDDVGLLWIKGGAGKGKMMMSIGLIERIPRPQDGSTVVTYFFCQNADYKLNTIEAIIKGLIYRLVNQQKELKESLRRRWDTANRCFDEDFTSWRVLWHVFLEMLDCCRCRRVYVVVDALDECQDEGMADLLKLIVRTGLHQPSKIKWLLTSRPLDSAERELLAGADQVLVSLELNSKHIAEAVKTYIAYRVDELDRRQSYGPKLRQEVEAELKNRAEDTYLWVSLACKKLEGVRRDEALETLQELPPGLDAFYHRILDQLRHGEYVAVKSCMRLLKVMMLAYRPLNVLEVGSVTGFSPQEVAVEAFVDRCASFIKMQGTSIEFVHQSARDFLDGQSGQSMINCYDSYGHSDITLSCVICLSEGLKANLIDLPRPDSSRELVKKLKNKGKNTLLARLDYAATFWVQHLKLSERTTPIQNALMEQGEVSRFLRTQMLEWLESLSLLDKLPSAVEAFKMLSDIPNPTKQLSISMLVQDAMRFLLRHYQTVTTWPLQIYSSAIVFSPQESLMRKNNLDKIPGWLKRISPVEDEWASLIQTLAGHSGRVRAVAFSPDGKRIASGSDDETVKLWDTATGDLQKTLVDHSDRVTDGKRIASGSNDKTIKLWDTVTGDLQKTSAGHSDRVSAVAFSPDGKRIASGSDDKTVKLWDTATGDLQKMLAGHSDRVTAVAFSPDGKWIASGSDDKTIKLWDVAKSLRASRWLGATAASHLKFRACWEIKTSESVNTLKFSADGQYLATNFDSIKIESILTGIQNDHSEVSRNLHISNRWLCYGALPVLRLQPDSMPTCYDVRDDQVAIGFRNGRVLNFDIDRQSLNSIIT